MMAMDGCYYGNNNLFFIILFDISAKCKLISLHKMDFSESSDSESTPLDVKNTANAAIMDLLPSKSKERYEVAYTKFMEWHKEKRCNCITETEVLAYIAEKSKIFKPSTLWSEYSMLKATLIIHNNIDISKFNKVVAFLKRKSDGYIAKKSRILTKEQIEKFLNEAPNKSYLMKKIALIFGISGALRRDELTKVTLDDIEDVGCALIIKVPDTKTKKPRTFTVTGNENSVIDFLALYREYLTLRPKHTTHRRLFVNYKNGKCSTQVVGRNTFGKIPRDIAEYLNLDSPECYTGHCFRRTSATLLADAGAELTTIKRHGGWKSSSVAETYIEDSINNKFKVANKILYNQSTSGSDINSIETNRNVEVSTSTSNNFPSFTITTGDNCNVNININKEK